MKILALDTATDACSAALLINDQIKQRLQIAPRRHAELILPMVKELLEEADCGLQQLDAIAYGAGPGSFMGVRIATATAQGLAFAAELPVVVISTLRALAQTAYQQHDATRVIPAWDARMQEVYWGAYQLKQGIMQSVLEDSLDRPNQITLPALDQGQWAACGNAWQVYQQELQQPLQSIDSVLMDLYPEASAVVRLAVEAYREGRAVAADKAEPVYLRNKVTQ